MPIEVICPGCFKRFRVNEKFAGQKGPCPSCKAVIQIPEKNEEVVVHAPTEGPVDSKGRPVLKPIKRVETKISPLLAAVVAVSVLIVLAVALYLRGHKPVSPVVLAVGALLLGPPLAMGGYAFLREAELEPHRGAALLLRASICGSVYAALWALFVYLPPAFYITQLETFHLLIFVPPLVVAGAVAALTTLDLDFTMGIIHYGLYLLTTVALCLIIGIPLLGGGS